MPFKSIHQMKACYATNGFNGKVNCDEWAQATKNIKSLPDKVKEMGGQYMKYRGKSTYLIGGDTPCYDKIGNEIPCPGKEMKNASDNGQWTKINQPTPPMNSPQANPSDLTHESGTRNQFEVVSPQHNKKDKIDPLFGLLGATTGLEWLSGAAERKRQNQYMYNQFDQLNQTNTMPATDFQPNPYSLYSKYGGKIEYKGGGNWIQGAVNPDHEGYCTPMSKSTCTGHRRAFALTMKKHHGFHRGKK